MYKNVHKITGFVSTLLLFALASPAHLDACPITVAVKDAWGSVGPGANVILRNENTGIDARTGVSNEQGNFNAPLLPSGSYSVHVELRGFKSYQQSGIYLQVNQQVTIPVALQVGEVSEQVTVIGSAPLVESTSGVIRETVDLPLGADVERVSAGGLQPEAEYHRSPEPVRSCPGQTGHVLNPAAFSRPDAYKFTAARTLP